MTKRLGKAELMAAVDAVESISDLFALVQKEAIDIRMHSFSSASNLPPKMLDLTDTTVSPLDKLKFAVKSAIENTREIETPTAEKPWEHFVIYL